MVIFLVTFFVWNVKRFIKVPGFVYFSIANWFVCVWVFFLDYTFPFTEIVHILFTRNEKAKDKIKFYRVNI